MRKDRKIHPLKTVIKAFSRGGNGQTGRRPEKALVIFLAAVIAFLLIDNCGQRMRNSEYKKTFGGLAVNFQDGVRENGFLRVNKNGGLVNKKGRAVQLRGLSSHGLIWYPQYMNIRAMLDLRARGANLFRAAMYADSIHEGYNETETTKRINLALMRLAIENALAADMYVIVDWHLLLDQNPLKTVEAAAQFFDEISSRYAAEPGLIYEICNEPNGETTWSDISQYARRVIPVIRKNAPKAVILVGTPNYSHDVLSVREAPLEFKNIMYSFHIYLGGHHPEYKTILDTMLENGLGVFVSEWGMGDSRTLARPDTADVLEFLDYLNQRKISWANWSLSNKDEDFSAVRPEVQKLSGWTDDDLTDSGQIVFRALRGK